MKNSFIVLLSVLLVVAMFSSCNKITEAPQETVDAVDTVKTTTTWVPNESLTKSLNTGEVPCVERYSFSSIDDFKFFCATGSRDSTLYSSPPQDNNFPPYNMLEGCFIDITQLFPEFDNNSIAIDHIEISANGRYSYSGYTNIRKTPFSISVRYMNESSDVTVTSVISAANNTSAYDRVMTTDYYDAKNEISSSDGSVLYVFELSKCIVQYYAYKGTIQGMAIYSGDYIIGVSPGYSDNDAFFTDETLTPLSCMFRNGEDRVDALNRVATLTQSK